MQISPYTPADDLATRVMNGQFAHTNHERLPHPEFLTCSPKGEGTRTVRARTSNGKEQQAIDDLRGNIYFFTRTRPYSQWLNGRSNMYLFHAFCIVSFVRKISKNDTTSDRYSAPRTWARCLGGQCDHAGDPAGCTVVDHLTPCHRSPHWSESVILYLSGG
jgi:hypothetical protein